MKILFLLTLLFLTLLFAIACKNNANEDKVIKVTIYNSSEARIDSVLIHTSSSTLIYENIMPGEVMQKGYINTSKDSYESVFAATIYRNDSIMYEGTFGYFTGSTDLQKNYWITITRDQKGFQISERSQDKMN